MSRTSSPCFDKDALCRIAKSQPNSHAGKLASALLKLQCCFEKEVCEREDIDTFVNITGLVQNPDGSFAFEWTDAEGNPQSSGPIYIPQKAAFGAAVGCNTQEAVPGDSASFHIPIAMTATEVQASVTIAPSGSDLTAEVRQGAAVLGTVVIPDGQTTGTLTITPTAFASMDIIEVEVISIGSSVSGSGLIVSITGTTA